MKRLSCLFLTALLAAGLAGCSRDSGMPASSGGHVHRAPHGGSLVEIGQHAYNLELVRDPAAGKLTAFVLDGHAERFVRIAAPAIELVAFVGGERRLLRLEAVPNPATGETVGNTSQFEGQADWLKSAAEFPGQVNSIQIRGTTFDNIAFYLRKAG